MEKQKQSPTNTTPNPKAADVKPVKDTVASKPAPEVKETSSGHPLLFLLGAGAVVVGGAITVLPALMPDQASLVNSLAKHGITGMPLALTGLLLCALAVVTKKKPDLAAQKHSADQLLVLEQVASDLIVTRGLIQDLRIEFVYLKDQVQTSISREEQEAQTTTTDAQTAMFRLAGSMDQLTGRLETRLGALDTAVNEQFGQVRSQVSDLRNYVDGLRTKIEEVVSSGPAQSSSGAYHVSDERQIEIEPGYESHEDDLSVQVLLDEETSQSLGLLDEFDEHGRHNSQKQSPSMRPTRRATDLDSQAGLLPSRNGRRRMDLEEKIAVLRELMQDPGVRSALDAARRHA